MSDLLWKPEELPPWALRTELPTVVRETCTSSQQISVWLAIRWLMAGRTRCPLGVREIAAYAKVNVKTVSTVIPELKKLRLLRIADYEKLPRRGLKAPHGRPILEIPMWIELENASFTMQLLARPATAPGKPPPPGQLSFSDPFSDQTKAIDPKTDQTIDPKTDQTIDPKTDQTIDPKTDHLIGREVGREVGTAHPPEKNLPTEGNLPPTSAAPPLPPAGEPALTATIGELWRMVRPHGRPIELQHLATLAGEHDAPTGGYGLYWVGRAILAASISQDVRGVKVIKFILESWRERNAYGSDAPQRQRKREEYERRTRTGPRDAAPRHDHPGIPDLSKIFTGFIGETEDGDPQT
jgi:hypothetical protein